MTVQEQFDICNQQIELVRLPDDAGKITTPARMRQQSVSRIGRGLNALTILQGLPTILAIIYFLGFAVNRYESVSTFVVRSPGAAGVSEIASLVQGTGVISSADDAYIVNEYMLSRDAMNALVKDDGLLDVFGHSKWDPLWARPGTFLPSNDERLYRHYRAFVSVDFDKTTNISTLRFQAFVPRDAQRIAAALLQKSEKLLNRLNERAQNDAIASALKQVEVSKKRALDALQNVTEFRNRESVIDPMLQSTVVLDSIAALSVELAETNAQLAELANSSPQSPQINSLRLRIDALNNQITKEQSRLGGSTTSFAPRIAEYERLILEREFASRAFILALTTLEAAKVDAQRRRSYLEQIAQPSLPDYAKYPFRLTWIFAIAACNFAICWILRHLLRDTWAHAGIESI